MRKTLRSEKGASSVLVILMLVVLVVFGVAALTTALSGMRLGQKVEEWNKKYYAAEAQANDIYAKIDKVVTDNHPFPNLSSKLPLQLLIEELQSDINVEQTKDAYLLDYEVWSEDVGISVVLKYNYVSRQLSPCGWKQIQRDK